MWVSARLSNLQGALDPARPALQPRPSCRFHYRAATIRVAAAGPAALRRRELLSAGLLLAAPLLGTLGGAEPALAAAEEVARLADAGGALTSRQGRGDRKQPVFAPARRRKWERGAAVAEKASSRAWPRRPAVQGAGGGGSLRAERAFCREHL